LFLLALPAASQEPRKVALTFDDLPSHGPLPPGMTRVDVAKSIVATLQKYKAPQVYGFVNGKFFADEPQGAEVFKVWTAAGFPLGSHTYSHMDLALNTPEAFEKDIAANEALLQKFFPAGDWHWFRYPFLHEGETAAKKHRIMAYLADHGYKIAEVTLSFDDYAFNTPYARCAERKDAAGVDELKASYLKAAEDSLRAGSEMARAAYGHDIRHVMLLHIGAFQTVMLPRLMELLREKGFQLIPLADAEMDPAYRIEPELPARWDGTLLEQMLRAKNSKTPAIAPFSRLEQICR
jgi:peptidoglycan/xylan/chitin deacetylase (PgdA/CDA1 family)